MSEVKYEMKPVTQKREKTKTIRSIFDPMIDDFIESGQELVEIAVEDKKPGYMVTQLNQRIKKRELDIEASRGGGFVYLEKKKE
ncbi:unnamed protein product [marine sediment metagenome]|uniref:Uncharacterized protein n=1 Tax=marine sediment metagenome TaxID=412755 RepID=X1JK04_9ZZZZ